MLLVGSPTLSWFVSDFRKMHEKNHWVEIQYDSYTRSHWEIRSSKVRYTSVLKSLFSIWNGKKSFLLSVFAVSFISFSYLINFRVSFLSCSEKRCCVSTTPWKHLPSVTGMTAQVPALTPQARSKKYDEELNFYTELVCFEGEWHLIISFLIPSKGFKALGLHV